MKHKGEKRLPNNEQINRDVEDNIKQSVGEGVGWYRR